MKNLYIATALLLATITGSAQTVQWIKTGVSEGFENGNALAVDDSGNVYTTGQIEYSTVFDGVTVYSNGSHDIFVAKHNSAGNLMWIRTAGNTGGDVGNGLAIDAAHNVYVTGEVEGTVDFGGGNIVTSAGANDIFLARYDAGGNIVWVHSWGNTGNDKGLAAATTPSGDCIITGYFGSTLSIGGSNLNSSGGRDVFLAKVNSSGVVQWAKKGGGDAEDRGEGLAVDNNGNIYLAGSYTEDASFSGMDVETQANYTGFIAKYNSSGSIQWLTSASDCCDTTQYRSIALDANNNVYISGHFTGHLDIGSTSFDTYGLSDALIVKYNSSGAFQWARRGGSSGEDVAYGITIDKTHNILYTTGGVSDAGNFGSQTYNFVGFKDIFVAAYDLSGSILWIKTYGGYHRDIGAAIATDPGGSIYSTGLFNSTATFDSYTVYGYPNQPWAEFYVDKISPVSLAEPTVASTNLSVTNGTCSDLDISFTPGNGSGRIVVMHAGSAVTEVPSDGIIYQGDDHFGDGTDIGNENFVVYNGPGNNVTVTGLDPLVDYYFSIFEYNGSGSFYNYSGSSLNGNMVSAGFNVNISGLQNSICDGQTLSLQASGASTYTWSPSSGLSSTSGANVVASPSSTTTYSLEAVNSSGCHIQKEFTITVNPLPVAHFPDLADVCEFDNPVTLTTGTPTGGSYTGPGVSGGDFDPQAAGPGTYVLIYTYTDANGCSDDNTASVEVLPAPHITLPDDTLICSTSSIVLSAGSGFDSYDWSTGSTSSSITINQNHNGSGSVDYTVEVENNGCTAEHTITVNYDPCLGIEETQLTHAAIYPSPFSTQFIIENPAIFSYRIVDAEGRMVETSGKVSGSVYTGETLSPGFYLVEITEGNLRQVFPLLKNTQ